MEMSVYCFSKGKNSLTTSKFIIPVYVCGTLPGKVVVDPQARQTHEPEGEA